MRERRACGVICAGQTALTRLCSGHCGRGSEERRAGAPGYFARMTWAAPALAALGCVSESGLCRWLAILATPPYAYKNHRVKGNSTLMTDITSRTDVSLYRKPTLVSGCVSFPVAAKVVVRLARAMVVHPLLGIFVFLNEIAAAPMAVGATRIGVNWTPWFTDQIGARLPSRDDEFGRGKIVADRIALPLKTRLLVRRPTSPPRTYQGACPHVIGQAAISVNGPLRKARTLAAWRRVNSLISRRAAQSREKSRFASSVAAEGGPNVFRSCAGAARSGSCASSDAVIVVTE